MFPHSVSSPDAISATNHWIVDTIELYDVPEEEIYELFDSRH